MCRECLFSLDREGRDRGQVGLVVMVVVAVVVSLPVSWGWKWKQRYWARPRSESVGTAWWRVEEPLADGPDKTASSRFAALC